MTAFARITWSDRSNDFEYRTEVLEVFSFLSDGLSLHVKRLYQGDSTSFSIPLMDVKHVEDLRSPQKSEAE